MNTYRPPLGMGTYKSPIKKISTAGSKIASAVQTASSAVQNARSPPKQQTPMSTQRRAGAGIRDRINKFDSACRYNSSPASRSRVYANDEKMQQGYRFNPNHRPDEPVDKVFTDQVDRANDTEEQQDKENTTNFASPHRKIKQKIQETLSPARDAKQRVHDILSPSRDNADRTIQKVKDTFSPITKRVHEEKARVQTVFSPNKKRVKENGSKQKKDILFSPHAEAVTTEIDSPSPIKNEESELRKRLQQLEAENEMLEKKNQLLTSKCQALTRENERLESSVDVKIKSEKSKVKKRHSNEHPLIASPLQNHVRAVQEASETNSFISVRKEPFQLYPPEYQCKSQDAERKKDHLGDLGVLTGNMQHGTMNTAKQSDEANYTREKRKIEEDMDLLNAAAFLFKTSRRRLN